MEKTVVKCSDCEATFTLKKNMYAHCRNIHQIEHLSKKPKVSKCHICDVKFANKKCSSQHMKTFHHDFSNKKHTRIICPYDSCEENLYTSFKLREHLFVKHNITVELEEITFDNFKEFETWKHNIERETVSMYVLDTGAKKMFDGVVKQYYFCHRSLNYRKSGKDLRMMKSTGSNKIGKTCPSKLETKISETDGISSVQVKYWKTHCGHAQEIGRLKIDKENRAMIAADDDSNRFYLENKSIGEQEELIEMISQPSMECTAPSTPGISGKIINKLELIRSLCATSEVSEEEDMLLNKKLDDVINMLNKTKKIHLNTVENINIQTKMTNQMRLYSTKKQRLHKNNIQKATENETNAIREGIESDNEYINIHQTFDHSY